MMWARRLIIGFGLAVTSLLVAPTVAGAAASCGSMSGVSCSVTPVIAASNSSAAPTTSRLPLDGPSDATAPTTTSSLPFTGADVEELAVVGAGAVLAGALLMRRRRQPA